MLQSNSLELKIPSNRVITVPGSVRRLSHSGLQFEGNVLRLVFFHTWRLKGDQREHREQIASLLDPGNSRLDAQHVVPLLNPDFPVDILEGGDG